jgi:hypothetical protein
VLPEAVAAILLIAVSALTVGLAVRNDSQPLAGLAIAGGFLAPILVGGSGGPLALFGYFAVLNAAIFALAWWKSWRALNVVGFVFTFVLGRCGGRSSTRPSTTRRCSRSLRCSSRSTSSSRSATCSAERRRPRIRSTACSCSACRSSGSHCRPRWSSTIVWRRLERACAGARLRALFVATRARTEPGFPLLSRAYAALAIIFRDDRHSVRARRSLHGGDVGRRSRRRLLDRVRQDARFGRAFALLVALGAGLVFVLADFAGPDDPLFANAFFVGAMLIGVAGLVIARIADGAPEILTAGERALVPAIFGWGALWWFAAGTVELVRQLPEPNEAHAVLAWITGSVALALALTRALRWPRLAAAGAVMLPAMAIAAFVDFHLARTTLVAWGFVVWPCAWIVHGWALHAGEALNRREGRMHSPPSTWRSTATRSSTPRTARRPWRSPRRSRGS